MQSLAHPPTYSAVLQAPAESKEAAVLGQLRNVIDPDFGDDIVTCGFIKGLDIDASSGRVGLTIELTTPACPVKEVFEQQAKQYVKVGPGPWLACARTLKLSRMRNVQNQKKA